MLFFRFLFSKMFFKQLCIHFMTTQLIHYLLSLIPNIFPLVATGAMRAFIDTSLDVASACSFAICLGIAVDDTIHFLMRFRHEREEGHDVVSSICRTFVTVGSASCIRRHCDRLAQFYLWELDFKSSTKCWHRRKRCLSRRLSYY